MNLKINLQHNLKNNLKRFLFCFIFVTFLSFQSKFQIVYSLPMENYQSEFITEELRLKVPAEFKEVWLKAEKKFWEPWLSKQDGFLERQLFWDKEKEEALILVNWESKKLWKSIPMSEVNIIQEKFEDNVKTVLNLRESPFVLIYEGELDKQG